MVDDDEGSEILDRIENDISIDEWYENSDTQLEKKYGKWQKSEPTPLQKLVLIPVLKRLATGKIIDKIKSLKGKSKQSAITDYKIKVNYTIKDLTIASEDIKMNKKGYPYHAKTGRFVKTNYEK